MTPVSVSVCPVATVHASVEEVWGLLSAPTRYALWWDAETRAIVPEGPAQPGQRIYAQTRAMGRAWEVNILVEHVDEARRQIQLTTRLPLGITVYNHITCAPVNSASCRVSFG
jgi:hypothetical protein